ncbi:hypothetical protein ABFS83_12G049400 [Erythranthe nasuta]
MSCLFWNCQGLGVPLTIHALGDIRRIEHPSLVFISETRVKSQLVDRLKMKWNLNGLAVDKIGKSGGLAMLWDKNVVVDLISISNNHIDVEVKNNDLTVGWRATGFYGEPDQNNRHRSWELLRNLNNQSDKAWMVGGDFNEILCNSDKEGGNPRLNSRITAFRDTLQACGLSEIGFAGYPFTWSNKQKAPNTVKCRLDRVCANNLWSELYPNAQVLHLDSPGSDHKPILLQLQPRIHNNYSRKKRPFRFEAMWIRRDECEDIIKQKWSGKAAMDPIEDVIYKRHGCAVALMSWSKTVLNQPRKRIES